MGLISWVPQCDTLHDLIKDYRDSRKTILNVEDKLVQQLSPSSHYELLTLLQKLEIFEHVLTHTPGDDLAKILWHRRYRVIFCGNFLGYFLIFIFLTPNFYPQKKVKPVKLGFSAGVITPDLWL